ncbi:MAG TPA: YihY/virulence factor BrkB family protein [Flavobacterium sp.]|uniref:YihY/virulence factor BrkB family protein n=1 Tax=Flavobacterium celericrescens TaxID=2709780 RepID=A0ABX0IJ25_9FLAO|nr:MULTISPECIES: YihY/virulence factor BrkB family protein [Flavobacterium]NHM05281.1 YihY/virulence factor BrkB family protein [Flavobacterium celericrescens]HLO73273.1 YihY/virulence factor BrkB family protein [Flavobacterium sp.]
MSEEIENKLNKIPVVKQLVAFGKTIKPKSFEGLSLYDILELYVIGIFKGAFSYRASAVAFSFFMALFPFALFILNLIPYIPLENFQKDFLQFVEEGVPPNTYDAIAQIISDIMNNSHQGLLSSGFVLSILLMTNGINAILGGFEMSEHITLTRGFFRQYFISLAIALSLSLILIITVSAIVISEIIIHKINVSGYVNDVYLVEWSRYGFVVLMILITTAILYKFGTKETSKMSFISYGAVFTTILIIISSYIFGVYVEKFARYNELYGSIGTLLVLMFYIWINCMVLLLGFELNATISKLKRKNLYI